MKYESSCLMSRRGWLGCIAGVAMALGLTTQADAQISCSATIDPVVLTPAPYAVGQSIDIRVRIGVASIGGGDSIEIPSLRYRLDCEGDGSCAGLTCPDDGLIMSYDGDASLSTNCGVGVSSNVPGGGAGTNELIFTFTPPVVLPPASSCDVLFSVTILSASTDATPALVGQQTFFDGQCFSGPNPTLTGSACGSLAVPISTPDIMIVKSADPETICEGVDTLVNYTYDVTNPGELCLENVMVTDDTCGPVMFVGGDVGGDGILCPGEVWMYACSTTISQTTTNIATVTGTAVVGGQVVMDTDTATVTAVPNPTCMITGPTLVCPGQMGIMYTVTATPGASIQWSISGEGQIVGSTTGASVTVNANVACDARFDLMVTVTSADNCVGECMLNVDVDDNVPPTITCPANQTIECPATPQFGMPTASDNCDQNPEIQIVSTVTTPGTCPQEFSVTRTWVAVDDCGNQSDPCSQTITVTDNTPPTIMCPANQTIDCPAEPMFGTPTASDLCDPNPMIQQVGEDVVTPGDCPQEFSVTRTWRAVDACGNQSAPCSQTITVTDNTPPTISCPPNQSIECPATPMFGMPTCDDDCGPCTIQQVGEDVVTPGDCPQEFSVTRTWIAVDACGNESDPCSQTIAVTDNTPPTITCPPGPIEVTDCEPITITVTAADNCDPNPDIECVFNPAPAPDTYSVTELGNGQFMITFNQLLFDFTITVTCTATDECGNASDPCSLDINVSCVVLECRVTGGGHSQFETKDGENHYTYGGQAGAPFAGQPQPFGEWTHHQKSGPAGKFVFHAGTHSAPPGTEIDLIFCQDEPPCEPAHNPAPTKQINFEGVGTFRNIHNPPPELAGVVEHETFHWFEVHIEDLGEPGGSGSGPQDPPGKQCPPDGSQGSTADCSCPDFYRITIYAAFDPETESPNTSNVIYEVFSYVDGGNLQIHDPVGGPMQGAKATAGDPNPYMPTDLNFDWDINGVDIGFLLSEWGHFPAFGDLNDDNWVDGEDLAILLNSWPLP